MRISYKPILDQFNIPPCNGSGQLFIILIISIITFVNLAVI